jgi:hypothetical protein
MSKQSLLIWVIVCTALVVLFNIVSAIIALEMLGDNPDVWPISHDLGRQRSAGVIDSVLIAPVLETGLLVGTIAIISRFVRRNGLVVLLSAIIAGALHAPSPLIMCNATFSFALYAKLYFYWRSESWSIAFFAAALPHVFSNGIVVSIRFAHQFFG